MKCLSQFIIFVSLFCSVSIGFGQGLIDNFKSLDKNYLKDTVLDKGGGINTINYFDTTRFYPLGDPIEVGYDLFFETGSIHTVKRYNQISNFSFEANYRVNGGLTLEL